MYDDIQCPVVEVHREALPTGSKAAPKGCIVRCGREEGTAKSQPDGQKLGTKAGQADQLTKGGEVPKVIATRLRRPSRQTGKAYWFIP